MGRLMSRVSPAGLHGQFMIGLLLGALWTPCVGPTLAAAVTLAARSEALWQVALAMTLYALGAAIPLAVIGMLSRAALMRWERKLSVTGRIGKLMLGLVMLSLAGAVLSGVDRQAETYLLQIWPEWLTRLAIRV
jgi:cytochrome c-type biogenesis protein